MRVRFRESLQTALRAFARRVPSLLGISSGCLIVTGCAAHLPARLPPLGEVAIPDVCARLQGGPPGTSPNLDLVKAHALARYFGVETRPNDADQRLADALESKTDYRPLGSCSAPAETALLEHASVTLENGVAIVRPGHGEVAIPASARAVAIDVRALPETDEARRAVERILPLVLHGDVALPPLEYRVCNGQPDEVAGVAFLHRTIEQYQCELTETRRVVHGQGRAIPSAVVVETRLTPVAAWTAAMLRGAADAFIVGADVPTQIAESCWVGLGDKGLAIRVARFRGMADVLPSDAPNLASVDWSGPRRRRWARIGRPPIGTLGHGYFLPTPPPPRKSDGQAALIVAHAALRTFFPYRDEIETNLDERFEEALTYLRGTPSSTRQALRRYAQALNDGHVAVLGGNPSNHDGMVRLVPVAGNQVAVQTSYWPQLDIGDVVVAIDHEPTATWLDEGARFRGGSPQQVRSYLGWRLIHEDSTVRVRKPNGEEHTVTAQRDGGKLVAKRYRAADPQVPGIAYIDLGMLSEKELPSTLDSIRSARGVILDMRGYPKRPAWVVRRYLCSDEARGPQMAELRVSPWKNELGPWQRPQTLADWVKHRVPFEDVPAVMLIGPDTQSQAEHLVTFFRSGKRGKLIGSATSGANGTITGVRLPGNFGLTFTGMMVRQPDGSPFHGIGHIPDIVIEPTASDLANNRDPVIERAIAELKP